MVLRKILPLLTASFLLVLALQVSPSRAQLSTVYVVEINGTISSVTAELVDEALVQATATSSPVILALDTPGGTLDATFRIIDSIERASVPVIGYVTPAFARAWSAGTFILLSTHVAAMAPNTIIGSAQPVAIGPTGGAEPVTDSKTINALVEFIQVRARAHGRNETAAAEFIRSNLNLNANEAKTSGVIEFEASSTRELLTLVENKTVQTTAGDYTFTTTNADIIKWSPSLRIVLLKSLADPLIASLLLFIGFYWLIFGISSPGHGSEIGGAILVVAGLIGLSALDVSIGALVLIGIGAILLVAELVYPGFGALGIGGFIAVVLGSLLLFSGSPLIIAQESLASLFVVLLVAPIAFGSFFLFAAYKVVQVRRRKPVGWSLIGDTAQAMDDLDLGKEGFVLYQGETWKAKSSHQLKKGEKVKITGKEGPVLIISPLPGSERDAQKGE